jgi:hypothetical protein
MQQQATTPGGATLLFWHPQNSRHPVTTPFIRPHVHEFILTEQHTEDTCVLGASLHSWPLTAESLMVLRCAVPHHVPFGPWGGTAVMLTGFSMEVVPCAPSQPCHQCSACRAQTLFWCITEARTLFLCAWPQPPTSSCIRAQESSVIRVSEIAEVWLAPRSCVMASGLVT